MTSRLRALGLLTAVAAACSSGSSNTTPQGKLAITVCTDDGSNCAVNTLLRDGSTLLLKIAATDAAGNAGTGSVTLTASSGSVDGVATETLTLDGSGSATAHYACDISLDSGCSASTTLVTASWNELRSSAHFNLKDPIQATDGGNTDAGVPDNDAGPSTTVSAAISFVSSYPASIAAADASGTGLPPSAVVSFLVVDVGAVTAPLPGVTVTFSTPLGENLLALAATTAVSDSNGVVNVVAASRTGLGVGHVVATLPLGFGQATGTVGIFGPPASVVETAETPSVLGIKGSGIQEQGLMTFLVTDAYGTPVPDAPVDFVENQPQLITLNSTSGTTDADGHVSVAYSAGPEIGVTSITATAHGTQATGVHSVAVRGARPSASGFYFRCDHGSLPVYDLITGYSTTTCHVRLSDRFGNRVGIPTPVNFATEAGAITASATTVPFNPDSPDNSAEGTVDVTFSTNGQLPADVIPLEAETDATTYPSQRTQAEPRRTPDGSQITYNPRDQLATIIAWTQGEEAFVDANHNGKYDPPAAGFAGELFVDQGDPFIDANDDDIYDQVVPGGQFEVRFCGSTTTGSCPTYTGPNGQWDAQTTIWTQTWVVFTGGQHISSSPAGQIATQQFEPTNCADYTGTGNGHSPEISADVYSYDDWFNPPVPGSTFKQVQVVPPGAASDVTALGFPTESDHYGAFGQVGVQGGFWYGPESANGGPCTTANGTQCVYRTHFQTFDLGYRGTLLFLNANAGTAGIYGCPAYSDGPDENNNETPTSFTILFGVTTPDGSETDIGSFAGEYAPTYVAPTDGGTGG